MSPSLRPTSSRRVTDMTRRAASLALCVLPCRRCQGSSRSRQHSVLQSARVRRVALLFRSRHRTSLSGLRRHGHHPDGPGLRFVPTGPDMITPRVNMASVELGEAVAISGRLAMGVVDAFERLRRSPRTLTAPFRKSLAARDGSTRGSPAWCALGRRRLVFENLSPVAANVRVGIPLPFSRRGPLGATRLRRGVREEQAGSEPRDPHPVVAQSRHSTVRGVAAQRASRGASD
jgi:hypothetical protein